MPSSSPMRRPATRAISAQSSSVTPSTGTNGTTSVAPMRGCCPECFVEIDQLGGSRAARTAASITGSGSPAKVSTERLWSASIS